MENALNFSVGTHYKLNEQWMLRGSIKYEQTPTVNDERQVAFPDESKLGLQIGSRYQMTKRIALDLIYGHVFVKEADIHDVNPLTQAVAKGHQNTHIDLLGAQFVVNI
jgi:long-chain fatty acid transport protein